MKSQAPSPAGGGGGASASFFRDTASVLKGETGPGGSRGRRHSQAQGAGRAVGLKGWLKLRNAGPRSRRRLEKPWGASASHTFSLNPVPS